jgi:hypothetical protein
VANRQFPCNCQRDQGVRILADVIRHRASAMGWRAGTMRWACSGRSCYFALHHPRAPRVYVRLSDHRSSDFLSDQRVRWSIVKSRPGALLGLLDKLGKLAKGSDRERQTFDWLVENDKDGVDMARGSL